ncbi:MAG TPA: hypothetical protein P5044_07860 [bacterium]|nr:hypothetical protein [bacterium]
MKVMKFGGISVKDASAIRAFADILKKDPEKKIVVVSAFFGITDHLRKLTTLSGKMIPPVLLNRWTSLKMLP